MTPNNKNNGVIYLLNHLNYCSGNGANVVSYEYNLLNYINFNYFIKKQKKYVIIFSERGVNNE